MRAWLAAVTPERAVQLFVLANLGFLGGDIAIAHLANDFSQRAEWAPLLFSGLAVPLLLLGLCGLVPRAASRWLDLGVAMGAIVLGVAGMLYHLASSFLTTPSLHNLVYAAPFVAPLSYVGVGLLGLLVRMEPAGSPLFGPWVLLLALGGVLGNFLLSVLDHAQNGFFSRAEWIPVAASALGAGFLLLALLRPAPAFLRLCLLVCVVEALVGLLGFGLHLGAHHAPSTSLLDRMVFGAPLFAPLLFTNIALLAAIGVWASLRANACEAWEAGCPARRPGRPG